MNYNAKGIYNAANEITYNTEVLKSSLSDYNNAYISVRGNITFEATPEIQVSFKNRTLFPKCITQIDGTTLADVEDLDLVMTMYNLIEYSSNDSETTGSLWFYSKDEPTNFNADIAKLIFLNLSNIVVLNYNQVFILSSVIYQKTELLNLHQKQLMEFLKIQQFVCH